ncbi:MAG TPA: sigma-70 family RNA polymerase sigma factor [Agriterribacter sp.]|nr:sigma-70 family RNA polymerase sigma factor [Agriterribacter sp.]
MTAEKNKTITQSIKAYSHRLFGFIRQRVASTEDAEDIMQDVFYQFAGNTEPIEQVTSWLFRVARNKITDRYRKKQPELFDDLEPASDQEGFDWKEIMPSKDDTPEIAYLRNLFWDELQLALNELPAEQREAFIQNEMEDIPFKDMAEATGVSVATLISRKRYAVLFLRERLQILKDELLHY